MLVETDMKLLAQVSQQLLLLLQATQEPITALVCK